MQEVRVKDRVFEIFIDEIEIAAAIDRMAEKMNKDLAGQNPLFAVVLNGAFMFASDLSKKINFDCEITFLRYSSYEGTSSTGAVKKIIGCSEEVKGRNIVIIEDIIDSGLTIQKIKKDIEEFQPGSIKVATFLFKPEAYKGNHEINYIGFEIPNDFIVGYGLDYNGYGRNLKDIYKLKQS
jgi:hypoxanthine phosphoribosyltransferase